MTNINMAGQAIGRWTVSTSFKSRGGRRCRLWLCTCACGRKLWVDGGAMRRGDSNGCQDCMNGLRPYEALYNYLSRSAKVRHLPITISYEDFVKFTSTKECFYCHSKIEWARRNRDKIGRKSNLDRKDNQQGYSVTNVVICCGDCNWLRRDIFTHEEFIEVVKVLMEKGLWPRNAGRRGACKKSLTGSS